MLTTTQKKSTGTQKKILTQTAKRPPCPLCGSPLAPARKLRSVSYPAGSEKIMHIQGCPYCAPDTSTLVRRCPVCGKVIPRDGFAVGRMWERGGKLHLHITGCTVCKPRYRFTE